jgi:uncharacterized protein (DUF983 family)
VVRGLARRCPNCGEARLFQGYATAKAECTACRHDLEPYRSDDIPAYFTIFIVGHLVVPALLMMERAMTPPLWLHAAIWVPATLFLALAFLPPIKGAVIGVQWALNLKSDR